MNNLIFTKIFVKYEELKPNTEISLTFLITITLIFFNIIRIFLTYLFFKVKQSKCLRQTHIIKI